MTQQYGMPIFEEIDHAMESNAPMAWGLQTSRNLKLVTDPSKSGLWLHLEISPADECPQSSVKAIQTGVLYLGNKVFLAIGSERRSLHSTVYSFLGGLVNRLETSGETVNLAVESEIASWIEFLRQEQYLGIHQQVGLLGELWLLWRLIQTHGTPGLDAWLGPAGEQHDFRLADLDIEVKTTTEPSRSHVVSSLLQLAVKPGAKLAVFSVQLQPAGQAEGVTLSVACERVRISLATDAQRQNRFVQYLARLGFSFDDSAHYKTAFNLRTSPTVISVDDDFPRLLERDIQTVLGDVKAQRILSATYRINVEGLGYDVNDQRFASILPLPASGDLYA